MPTRLTPALLALAAAALAAGCVEFNPECAAPVANAADATGWLAGDVDISKPVVRTADNPVGQMVAEAYAHAFDARAAGARPDLAVLNSGSVRSDGICGQARTTLKKGAVTRGVLREVLYFDNRILVGTLTHHQLKNVLEHAVAVLSPSGTGSPAGAFLQLYGLRYEADCTRAAETLKPDGSRDQEGQRVTRVTLLARDGSTREIPLGPPSDMEKVKVAAPEFLFQAQGNDGYYDLRGLNAAPETFSAGGFDFEIVAAYFLATYPKAAPLPATPAPRSVLTNCQ
jgi:2',3'-cyclic-nucleotide 2'-phosphodiesterase (5'-nucleotidase family)